MVIPVLLCDGLHDGIIILSVKLMSGKAGASFSLATLARITYEMFCIHQTRTLFRFFIRSISRKKALHSYCSFNGNGHPVLRTRLR